MEGKPKRDIRFCPICGSIDIWWLGGLPHLAPYMECRRCGHRNVFIIGDKELAGKIQDEYFKKREKSEG